jgi:hypothetical protein
MAGNCTAAQTTVICELMPAMRAGDPLHRLLHKDGHPTKLQCAVATVAKPNKKLIANSCPVSILRIDPSEHGILIVAMINDVVASLLAVEVTNQN